MRPHFKETTMPEQLPSTRNQILNALPNNELEILLPHLERVNLPHAHILYRPDEKIEYVYFPDGAMISIIAYTEGGQSAEVGIIGGEGAAGVDAVLGAESTPNESVVQFGSGALRIKTETIRKYFGQCGVLHDSLLSFTQKLMMQISQKALCNRLHPLDERLSRWLLMCHDRSDSNHLRVTQELLAVMLGATRASVTLAAIEMQNTGYITYSRGNITIVDRDGLESITCDCYETIRRAYKGKK